MPLDYYRKRIASGGRRRRVRTFWTSVLLSGLLANLPREEREVLLERAPGRVRAATPKERAALGLPAAEVRDPRLFMTLVQHGFSPVSAVSKVSRLLNERCAGRESKIQACGDRDLNVLGIAVPAPSAAGPDLSDLPKRPRVSLARSR
jgi:hypothetical protein